VPLHVAQRERVRILTLDDAERRNALTATLVDEIVAAVEAAEADDGVGALVVTGAPPAFCSGADTSNLAALGSGGDARGVQGIYDGFLRVRDCSLPTVAAVNGPAVGAGFNLALACDVRLVAYAGRFDTRFAKIGLHPGGGHVWMLEREIGPQAAAAMVLFGERVDSERAVALGLAWRRVPDDELLDAAVALAGFAADLPRELAQSIKATLRDVPWQPDFDTAVATELERQRKSFESGEVARRLAR
jgi:enoyl-CoA hydratase